MKKTKLMAYLVAATSAFSLVGCKMTFNKGNNSSLPDGMTVLYFDHIDGEGNYDFKPARASALITNKIEKINDAYNNADKVVGYQVSYISCNCRSVVFNHTTGLYVEMTASKGDLDNPDKSRIVKLSFGETTEVDDYGHYADTGHWGDSYAMDRNTNVYASAAAKAENLHGVTHEDFSNEIVPMLTTNVYEGNTLPGIDKATLHDWMTNKDNFDDQGFFQHENIQYLNDQTVMRYTATLDGYNAVSYSDSMSAVSIVDAYAGASVSLDNMLALLDALFAHHADVLTKIKKDPKKAIFYSDSGLDFTGTYHLEKDTSGETTELANAAALDTLLKSGAHGTYMIYTAKEGCETCNAFSKAVKAYVAKFKVKIYAVSFSEAKTLDYLHLTGAKHGAAPQLFLVDHGTVIDYATQDVIDAAAESGSALTIYDGFTKTLLAE